MNIDKLEIRKITEGQNGLTKAYKCLERTIDSLNKIELPSDISSMINHEIKMVNAFSGTDKEVIKAMKTANSKILKEVMEKLKLVTKNHYRNIWMAVGMSAFGIPMGVAFSAALNNYGFIGIGLPIGMAIGIAIGTGKDKEAADSGLQLDIEV
jgi:hypothetical protein